MIDTRPFMYPRATVSSLKVWLVAARYSVGSQSRFSPPREAQVFDKDIWNLELGPFEPELIGSDRPSSVCRFMPVVVFQNLMVWSFTPEARPPLGEKTTKLIESEWPFSVCYSIPVVIS